MDWLEKLRSAGPVESSGRFTLDPEKARQKLARFTFHKPRQHLQNLVAAAVYRGATGWDLSLARGRATITFDGPPASADDLRELFDSLLGEGSERWLSCLALGVLGATRESKRVVVQSALGPRLTVDPTRTVLDDGPVGGPATTIEICSGPAPVRPTSVLPASCLRPSRPL